MTTSTPPSSQDRAFDLGTGARRGDQRLPALGLRAYIAILLAVAIAPIGAVGIVQTVVAQRENDALRVEAYINQTIEVTAAETRAVATAFGVLATLGRILALPDAQAECVRVLTRVDASRPRVDHLAVLDAEGRLRCASDASIGVEDVGGLALAEEMSRVRRPTVLTPDDGREVLYLAHPLFNAGAYEGFIALTMPRGAISLFSDEPHAEPSVRRHQAMFDNEGRVIAHSSSLDGPQGTDGTSETDWLPSPETLSTWVSEPTERRRAYHYTAPDGVRRTYVALPVVDDALYALVGWATASAEEAAAQRLALAVLFPIAMWAVGIAIAFFAVNTLLLRNVLRLARVMGVFARGRRGVRMTPAEGAPVEIVALSESFNHLAERLETDERAMEAAIEEKNTLLKEVYHRVKNNLQLIVSMMNLQIRQTTSDAEREALRRLQSRVQGLALVHQRLYQASSLAAVRMDLLLDDLARRLREVQRLDRGEVEFSLHSEPVALEPDRAVPVSLFASEAIENAFKHGIVDAGAGRLSVTLQRIPDGWLRLEIANTVAPRPKSEDSHEGAIPSTRGRLGTRLLEAFARQLGGTLTRETMVGWHKVTLCFPPTSAQIAERVSETVGAVGPFADTARVDPPAESRVAGSSG